ncbi:pyridoxal phosphate-dependent aminotransferase [Salipaludibacillus agaradhaerens]|uniref:Pyridoxal phosphate-dependent aminotransferase n=1 Tax=Salipaludibacillus agaradhaerens TaxID=76935 RepID=A0A9Q4B666_SALAG|nr:pyridoxal phosphate-dependent aminotransferase [Salipaludibacillus agaradhaerens]MCR6098650.1 pyridoxal phosphate-dependent aminotransferase [Salipaludibacillus agaradhaerens]MCR6115657.1 pyridoxal phosphate-dependent aminotransferase [Salipaludibacillus agaradhaerens]
MRRFEPSDTVKRLPEQFFAKLVKKAHDLTDAGHDVINLGQGNPDLPTPTHIVDELKYAADNPEYHKYSPFRGQLFLKEAISDFYKKEYNVSLDPAREVAILAGSKTGLVDLSQCLLNPGDIALLPDPGYPDYMSGIAIAQASTSFMPLRAEHDFLPDYASLSSDILDRAKLMFLNYPNNPTAGMATPSFFNETVEVAKRHHICVCHDFAYAAIGFDGEKPQSFLQSEGAKEIGIEMYTLSKTFNMAGWRAAFAVGNASVIETINLMQDHKYMSLFGAVQQAAMHALVSPQDAVRQLVTTYEKRRDLFIDALRRAGWHVPAPKGTFFAWLPVPAGYSSEEFADLLLEKAHVVVAPGIGFGDHGEGFVRAGLVASEERLREAAARIEKLNLF